MDTVKLLPMAGCSNTRPYEGHDPGDSDTTVCDAPRCYEQHPVAPKRRPRRPEITIVVEEYPTPAAPDPRQGSTQNVLKSLPEVAGERKAVPITTGVLDYFPLALVEVARLSKKGNDQHNPGQPLHWARGKSSDHADCLVRHLLQRGVIDTDGITHTAKVAWRALALLQEEMEAAAGFTP